MASLWPVGRSYGRRNKFEFETEVEIEIEIEINGFVGGPPARQQDGDGGGGHDADRHGAGDVEGVGEGVGGPRLDGSARAPQLGRHPGGGADRLFALAAGGGAQPEPTEVDGGPVRTGGDAAEDGDAQRAAQLTRGVVHGRTDARL